MVRLTMMRVGTVSGMMTKADTYVGPVMCQTLL